jgi:hypothetical protein
LKLYIGLFIGLGISGVGVARWCLFFNRCYIWNNFFFFNKSFILFYFFQNVLSFEKRFVFYFEKCISDRNYARLILRKKKKKKKKKRKK